MRTVGIRTLEHRLREYLRLVEAGETVLVKDRTRVIAEFRPPSEGSRPRPSGMVLASLVSKGLVNDPTNPRAPLPKRRPVAPLRRIMAGIEEDRADR